MWKPVISKTKLDWVLAHLPQEQREQFTAMVDVYPSEPVAELNRERLAADLDRLAGDNPEIARGRVGSTSAFALVDEIRGWSSPRGSGKTEQARRHMDAWIAAHEKATGRKPDVVTVGRDKPEPLEHLVFDYADQVDRQSAGGGEPMTTWSSVHLGADDQNVIRELQREYDQAGRHRFRRYYEGTWMSSRQGPDDPELKPYLDVMDAAVERLARESGTPAAFLDRDA